MSEFIFQKFLAQLAAKNYAKADGFDLSWYDKMSSVELKKAEQLLLQQAYKGDMSPIPSLAKIASPEAVTFLKKLFDEKNYYSASGLDYELAKYLWNITHEEKYLSVFDSFEGFNKLSKTVKARIIKYLGSLPDYKKRINQLMKFIDIDYKDSGFNAAVEILRLLKKIDSSYNNLKEYKSTLDKITSANISRREEGQLELMSIVRASM